MLLNFLSDINFSLFTSRRKEIIILLKNFIPTQLRLRLKRLITFIKESLKGIFYLKAVTYARTLNKYKVLCEQIRYNFPCD